MIIQTFCFYSSHVPFNNNKQTKKVRIIIIIIYKFFAVDQYAINK